MSPPTNAAKRLTHIQNTNKQNILTVNESTPVDVARAVNGGKTPTYVILGAVDERCFEVARVFHSMEVRVHV